MIYDLIIVVPTKGRKFLQFKIVIIETIKKVSLTINLINYFE